jgi:hypothetical protein
VQQGVFETNGIAIAPSVEFDGVSEVDGLQGSQSASGDFFSFDIKAPCNSLEEEVHFAVTAGRVQ